MSGIPQGGGQIVQMGLRWNRDHQKKTGYKGRHYPLNGSSFLEAETQAIRFHLTGDKLLSRTDRHQGMDGMHL